MHVCVSVCVSVTPQRGDGWGMYLISRGDKHSQRVMEIFSLSRFGGMQDIIQGLGSEGCRPPSSRMTWGIIL